MNSSSEPESLAETQCRWYALTQGGSKAQAGRIQSPEPAVKLEAGGRPSPSMALAQLPIGHVLGARYRLEAVLGRGGQGVVYRGTDLSAPRRRKVAIKVRRCPQGVPPILASLRHPNIQGFIDWGREGELEFCVLRFHNSPDLKARLEREGPFPAPLVARWGAALLRALGHLHRQGVLHRDVKPSNVLLAGQRPVLIDFDLACVGSPQKQGLVGTPLYMSPERLQGAVASPDDDVFACALTVFELACGSLPAELSNPQTLQALKTARRLPLPSTGDPGLDSILGRALDSGRGRLRSARTLGRELRAFAKQAGQPELPEPPPLPPLGSSPTEA